MDGWRKELCIFWILFGVRTSNFDRVVQLLIFGHVISSFLKKVWLFKVLSLWWSQVSRYKTQLLAQVVKGCVGIPSWCQKKGWNGCRFLSSLLFLFYFTHFKCHILTFIIFYLILFYHILHTYFHMYYFFYSLFFRRVVFALHKVNVIISCLLFIYFLQPCFIDN